MWTLDLAPPLLFEALSDAVVVASADNRIVFVNGALERLLGWSRHDLVGQRLTVLMPERMGPAHEAGFFRYMRTHEPRIIGRPIRVPACHRDRTEIDVELTLSVVRQGADLVVIATLRDLRERIELERMLADTQSERAQIETALHLRDDFLAVAGHELRTPLATLMLQVENLQRTIERDAAAPELVLEGLGKMERQVERLHLLVGQLLDVSRITAERLALTPEVFDLGELVNEVVERISSSDSTATPIHVLADAPVRGQWDRNRIDQVLTNVIGNAVKYGAQKPIDVRLSESNDRVTIIVRDRGIGIAPEDQGRIFGRFERAVSSRNYGGLGLGLWIVRQIVEEHGGAIRLQSEPGGGTEVTIELPRVTRS